MSEAPNLRILLVDDNPAIHEDFRKILAPRPQHDSALEEAEAVLFGGERPATVQPVAFPLESAFQGKEALEKVREARNAGRPFALAFVDVRMPPGWDGLETIEQLWKADPALQVVVCTAYSDYSWEKMSTRLGINENLVILKKPFDNIEVLQLAHALTRKWNVTEQARLRLDVLDRLVADRTASLQAANDNLRRSEERFSTAFRASPIPVAILASRSGRLVDLNEAFVNLTGMGAAQLIACSVEQLRKLIKLSPETLRALELGESVRNAPAQIASGTAEPRQILISFEPVTLGGEPHLLIMAQDISERLRLEAQLRQSQKMEAIGQLAAGVAHDFNNLLTIIQGHASLQLGQPGLSADLADSLGEIEHAAERAAELTRQLLAFSRRQIIHPRAIHLNELINGLVSMLKRLLGEAVELHCHLDQALPRIWADQTGIEQVLMNLTLNARDSMPKGGRITLFTESTMIGPGQVPAGSEALAGEHVCLGVTDTGSGMDPATRARIFEPFFTTKDVNKGTGMGLATVHGIVHQHRGWIDVVTAPGKGSTFRVYLPATHEAPAPAAPAVLSVPRNSRQDTILVVEDDDAVRSLVREVLEHHQYRVLEASTSEQALEVWRSHRAEVDLLLTDLVMPGNTSGLDLAQQLLAERPSLRVVYTTGYSAEVAGTTVHLQEGVNYLPKPYLSSKLTAILHTALAQDSPTGPAAPAAQ